MDNTMSSKLAWPERPAGSSPVDSIKRARRTGPMVCIFLRASLQLIQHGHRSAGNNEATTMAA
eukprot:10228411-Alexandrium_andersonii.AAC.1